jgi:hypothetical protein
MVMQKWVPRMFKRLFGRTELRRGPCYGGRRIATEARDVLCCDCAGREPRRAAWWRLVYALTGPQRCSRCGREFTVTRRATGTADPAATEMDAVWPVPGAQSPARPVHTPRSAAQPVSPRIPLTDSQHDRLWTAVVIVILAGFAVLFNLACIRTPLPYSPAGVANPPPSPHPAIALPAAPWWVTNAQTFVEANCK